MDAKTLIKKIYNDDADGWYVHCADKPVLDRESGYVTLMVPVSDMDAVTGYGDVYSLIKPAAAVDIESLTDDIMNLLKEGEANGTLPIILDEIIEHDGYDAVVSGLNPHDIVGSAGLWDVPEVAEWWYDRMRSVNMIITQDGAVSTCIEDAEAEIISIAAEEWDEIWDKI